MFHVKQFNFIKKGFLNVPRETLGLNFELFVSLVNVSRGTFHRVKHET